MRAWRTMEVWLVNGSQTPTTNSGAISTGTSGTSFISTSSYNICSYFWRNGNNTFKRNETVRIKKGAILLEERVTFFHADIISRLKVATKEKVKRRTDQICIQSENQAPPRPGPTTSSEFVCLKITDML